MKITHKMTVADRLREILRVRKWKQKELAGKFGVSEKTVSFWVNDKKRPAEAHMDKIEKLYRECVETEPVDEFEEKVREYQSKEGLDETEKVFTVDEKTYYEAKCYVLAQEKSNNRYVYLFPSISKEPDGWYKAGDKSLVFYKNLLAPRMGREAKIRDDTDKIHKFGKGIVSVRWGEKFMAEVQELGYGVERVKYGIIVVDLGKEYDGVEMKEMKEAVKKERSQVKKMVKPKANYPSIMVAMNKLTKVLPSKVKKLDNSYREIWGKELLEPMTEMMKIYFRFANGRMEKRDARLEILERTDDLAAMIYMMDESGMLTLNARTRLGENIMEIRKEVEEQL